MPYKRQKYIYKRRKNKNVSINYHILVQTQRIPSFVDAVKSLNVTVLLPALIHHALRSLNRGKRRVIASCTLRCGSLVYYITW